MYSPEWYFRNLKRRLRVWWPADQAWYNGTLVKYRKEKEKDNPALIVYDDGDKEQLNLCTEKFEWLDKGDVPRKRRRLTIRDPDARSHSDRLEKGCSTRPVSPKPKISASSKPSQYSDISNPYISTNSVTSSNSSSTTKVTPSSVRSKPDAKTLKPAITETEAVVSTTSTVSAPTQPPKPDPQIYTPASAAAAAAIPHEAPDSETETVLMPVKLKTKPASPAEDSQPPTTEAVETISRPVEETPLPTAQAEPGVYFEPDTGNNGEIVGKEPTVLESKLLFSNINLEADVQVIDQHVAAKLNGIWHDAIVTQTKVNEGEYLFAVRLDDDPEENDVWLPGDHVMFQAPSTSKVAKIGEQVEAKDNDDWFTGKCTEVIQGVAGPLLKVTFFAADLGVDLGSSPAVYQWFPENYVRRKQTITHAVQSSRST